MMLAVLFAAAAFSVAYVECVSPSQMSATSLVEPLQQYLDMVEVGSPLTASVYVVTQAMTWNNSMSYCQTTMSTMLNTNCYLAEILTLAQRSALTQAIYGNAWTIWTGAYLKPNKNSSKWVWYHTGYEIAQPNTWMAGYPTTSNAPNNYAGAAYVAPTWGVDLMNAYPPTNSYYFACTCW